MNYNGELQRDDNDYPVMGGTSTADNTTVINSAFNPVTRALLVSISGGIASGVWYNVSGTINGVNTVFSIPVAVTNDFILMLARQPQAQDVSTFVGDYSYSVGASTTTITYHSAPDASFNGQQHQAYIVS